MHWKDTYGTCVIIVKLDAHFSNFFADRLDEIIVSKILFWSSQTLKFSLAC